VTGVLYSVSRKKDKNVFTGQATTGIKITQQAILRIHELG